MISNMMGDCVACIYPNMCAGNGACVGYVCQTPSCTDGVKNQDETDVDCGGAVCIGPMRRRQEVQATRRRLRSRTLLCQGGRVPAGDVQQRHDARHGTETDVDCGGGACLTCADGQKCTADTDCASNLCQAT